MRCGFPTQPNATRCHQVQVFKEVNRVLKTGCMFGGYEWVVTEKYDPANEEHVALKEGIEVGNGLPTLATPAIIKANLEEAGFEVSSRTFQIRLVFRWTPH